MRVILSIIAFSMLTSVGFAKEKVKCDVNSSPVDVIFGSCLLEKGKSIYSEDIASLSSLGNSLSGIISTTPSTGH